MRLWRSISLFDDESAAFQHKNLETDMSPQDRFDLRLARLIYARQHHGGFLPGVSY